ncbi:MAG TPA: hypothetical protein VKY31_15120 [Terriglobia bacterium]|nr:hypothetical protein [Terriglobia bacterium]
MELREFLSALGRSIAESVRRNKLPASLSLIALILTTTLALTSNYDERPRYRKFILPEIHRAEMQFFNVMSLAEQEPTEPQRMLDFIEAHRRARNVLKVIESERPLTDRGRKAQADLTRYYESVDEELAIIRTQMSNDESYDYIGEWKRSNAELIPLRQRWLKWLNN